MMFLLREVADHKLPYIILASMLLLFVGLLKITWTNLFLFRIVIIFFAAGYFTWGVTTHVHTRKLTPFVLQEYAAVAILGGLLLLLLTF